MIESYSLPFSRSAVDDLRDRLHRTRWPEEISGSAWTYGFDRAWLQDLCRYWHDSFDWKAQLDRLAAFHHYRFQSPAGNIHFIHERGKGPAPVPLILTHGWPGSFLEMLHILPLLTDPEAHGGDPADAFDVIIPSLPGYGFSDRPSVPGMNTFRIADLWAELMQALGYDRFAAQGGDIGASVTTILGLRHADRVLGIHLNFIPGSYQPPPGATDMLAPADREFMATVTRWSEENGAYSHLQATRPQTAAYALNDSPPASPHGSSKNFASGQTAGAISIAPSRATSSSQMSPSIG